MANRRVYTREDKIKREVGRIKRLLKAADVDENKVKALEGVIQRAGFLRVMCEEFEAYLLEHGFTEPFTQSANIPPYNKKRAEADLYATSLKDYKALCKQITDAFESKMNINLIDDGFDAFVNGGK
ncbi:hypothetical protein ACE1MS_11790 [Lysinibacillus sp. fkY74-1]